MSLEDTIGSVKDKWLETSVKLSQNEKYQKAVDIFSGWMYYTPTYAVQEWIAGKDVDTIIRTRELGLLVHAVSISKIGQRRNRIAKERGITKESPLIEKIKLNIIAITPVQAVVYAGMLGGGMVWTGKYDVEKSFYAWFLGVGIGVLHTFPYGYFQDRVRRFFGVAPAVQNRQ